MKNLIMALCLSLFFCTSTYAKQDIQIKHVGQPDFRWRLKGASTTEITDGVLISGRVSIRRQHTRLIRAHIDIKAFDQAGDILSQGSFTLPNTLSHRQRRRGGIKFRLPLTLSYDDINTVEITFHQD